MGNLERPSTEAAANATPLRLDFAERIVDLLADRKAADVVLLDIHQLASFADYFVIASGTSERHMQALTDGLRETLEREGVRPVQVEGTADSGWILMDYSDVIVHVFSPETRDYYRLERIWAEAPTIVRVQ